MSIKINKHTVIYPNVPSVIIQQPPDPEVQIPFPLENTELQDNIEDIEVDDTDILVHIRLHLEWLLTQGQLNDLSRSRDLGLSKENAQLLASPLGKSSSLSQLLVQKYEFKKFFIVDSCNCLVYWNDVKGLI